MSRLKICIRLRGHVPKIARFGESKLRQTSKKNNTFSSQMLVRRKLIDHNSWFGITYHPLVRPWHHWMRNFRFSWLDLYYWRQLRTFWQCVEYWVVCRCRLSPPVAPPQIIRGRNTQSSFSDMPDACICIYIHIFTDIYTQIYMYTYTYISFSLQVQKVLKTRGRNLDVVPSAREVPRNEASMSDSALGPLASFFLSFQGFLWFLNPTSSLKDPRDTVNLFSFLSFLGSENPTQGWTWTPRKQINEILGPKLEDRFSDPFFGSGTKYLIGSFFLLASPLQFLWGRIFVQSFSPGVNPWARVPPRID